MVVVERVVKQVRGEVLGLVMKVEECLSLSHVTTFRSDVLRPRRGVWAYGLDQMV